jgi:hypothetical protein
LIHAACTAACLHLSPQPLFPAGAYTTLVKLQMQHQEEEEAKEFEREEVLSSDGRPLTRSSLERVDSKRRSASLEIARAGSGAGGVTSPKQRMTVEEALAAEAAEAAARAAAAQAE